MLIEHSTLIWAVLSGVLSGTGALILHLRRINASIERVRLRAGADAAAAEQVERAAFRASLMAEISAVRLIMKECESDRETLRERLATAEAQILVLKASNEIMEKWVAFFRDGIAPQIPSIGKRDDTA